MRSCTHFIGFKDDRVHSARKVFGKPDFYHRHWDNRAASMIADGDVAIFADGDDKMTPHMFAFDDSQMQ